MDNQNDQQGRKRVFAENETDANEATKKSKRSSQACVYCQRLKMKCSGSFPCERCMRVGRDCKLPQQAVRQPWSRKKDMEIQMLNTRLEEMERKLYEKERAYHSGSSEASTSTPMRAQTILKPEARISQDINSHDGFSHWLPFVSTGLVSLDESKELFELFMHNCVLHVALVDPEWHTFARVSKDCHFLFACIIFVASTYSMERPNLREELKGEMNELIGSVVTRAEKSVSIVQGFLFLYFFNTPPSTAEQDTAWLYSGIAIRIASELNLGSTNKMGKETARERVDRERTWMMTFIVDRSLSTTRGKAWTIRGDDNIVRNSNTWCDQHSCRPWDLEISTLADLLKVTSRQIDALNTTLSASTDYDDSFDCETMMRIMNEELEEWRRRWHARGSFTSPLEMDSSSQGGASNTSYPSPMTDGVDIHQRTFHYLSKQGALRFNYAVLVLNCFGLQYCASHPEKAAARTYSLTQAIRAAQSLVNAAKDGLRYTVTYSPHSQCTIITFGIVSLIKLASLKRDDHVVSQNLIGVVESGISFLESVAIKPTHVAARSASFLRGLLRRSLTGGATESTFRPGMEVHSLPARSSRQVSPSKDAMAINGEMMLAPLSSIPLDPQLQGKGDPNFAVPTYDEQGNVIQPPVDNISNDVNLDSMPWQFAGNEALDLLTNVDPSLLFGKEGSIGFGGLTADELLNDSFWLRLPERSPV